MTKIDLIGKKIPLTKDAVRLIVNGFSENLKIDLANKIIEIKFVDDIEMTKLNKHFRKTNETTDVLSFPQNQNSNPNQIYGTIVISPSEAQARNESISQLILHGLMHLAGYDHELNRESWNKAGAVVGHNMGVS